MTASESQNGIVVRGVRAAHQPQEPLHPAQRRSFHNPARCQRIGANIERFNIVKRQNFERRDVIARQHRLGLLSGRSWNAIAQKENADIFG
jgi:hypothetical protein